jgi:hypothetical protein
MAKLKGHGNGVCGLFEGLTLTHGWRNSVKSQKEKKLAGLSVS